jgi:branched-chain amino acid transport system substrate-binding protein
MNMYIAKAVRGRFTIVKNLGPIDPNERTVDMSRERDAVAV